VPWLADHVLLNQIVFPAAAYIAMVGESLRQLHNSKLEAFVLKDFSISSALLLRSGNQSKIRTRMRTSKQDVETTQWYEFQIASFDGNRWIENSTGRTSALNTSGANKSIEPVPRSALQRHVAQAYWYDVLESKGLKYGPVFQGLEGISVSPVRHEAVATTLAEESAHYMMHPITIERCLQMLTVAECKGQGRKLTGLSVVTDIEYLTVSRGKKNKLNIGARSKSKQSGGFVGDLSAVSEDGHPVLEVRNCEASPIPISRHSSEDKIFSFVKWDTDASYCNLNKAFQTSNSGSYSSALVKVLGLLAHKNPKLRILEVGNTPGVITRSIFNVLQSVYGERLYSSYTYAATTFDETFRAKKIFKEASDINVVLLDIQHQIQTTMLPAAAYDVIITANVCMPSPCIRNC
jgi:acyl transferase domain-containing protein